MKTLLIQHYPSLVEKIKSVLPSIVCLLVITMAIFACDDDDTKTPRHSVVYIESNATIANQNSILAYEVADDGSLQPLPGSPFLTEGTGLANPMQTLGPNDLDVPMIVHNNMLYAVNSGSHTIAVMQIFSDGSLSHVAGSPFASGGENPVSLALKGDRLYVANKSQDPTHGNTVAPNYTVLSIDASGAISGTIDVVQTTTGASPTFAYIPDNSNIMFAADFLGFMEMPPVGTLRSFQIVGNGLDPEAGAPQSLPVMGGALGLVKHPKENTLYVGFPLTAEIGIYSFDNSGALTFKNKVAAGKAACWLRTNTDGTRLYSLNSAEATVSIYDITDGQNPGEIQKIELKEPGPIYTTEDGMMPFSSQPFHIELFDDSRGYIISQRANPSDSYQTGNFLHVMDIDADGKLIESTEPLVLPVPYNTRPQGIAFLRK